MREFLYLLVFRILSGLQNGLGYAKSQTARLIVSIILLVLAVLPILLFIKGDIPGYAKVIAVILAMVGGIGVLGVEDNFNEDFKLFIWGIHFWEMVATTALTFAWIMAGANVLLVAASIYPALIFHKALINIGSGFPFWHIGTDDPTGRTVSILGFKVIRGGNAWRLLIAVFSIALGVMTWVYGWTIQLFPFIIDLHGSGSTISG